MLLRCDWLEADLGSGRDWRACARTEDGRGEDGRRDVVSGVGLGWQKGGCLDGGWDGSRSVAG